MKFSEELKETAMMHRASGKSSRAGECMYFAERALELEDLIAKLNNGINNAGSCLYCMSINTELYNQKQIREVGVVIKHLSLACNKEKPTNEV